MFPSDTASRRGQTWELIDIHQDTGLQLAVGSGSPSLPGILFWEEHHHTVLLLLANVIGAIAIGRVCSVGDSLEGHATEEACHIILD